MESVRYFNVDNSLILREDNSLWAFSSWWIDPIVPRKIIESVESVAVGRGGPRSVRIYAITTDGDLLTWIQMQNREPVLPTPPKIVKILDSVVSVHAGEAWRFCTDKDRDVFSEILDELTGVSAPEGGSYAITADGKLWRIGNHEPREVLDSVTRIYIPQARANLGLRTDGSVWAWHDGSGFPELIFPVV